MIKRTCYQTAKPLVNPRYADLIEISRCVHFDDFEEAVRLQMIVPQLLTKGHKSLRRRVLWFAASHLSSEHNFYGNVSFTIKWETVLTKLGPNLYLIDQEIYNGRSFTRIIFTPKTYDGILKEVDLDSNGSPLIKSDSCFRHASHCMNEVRWGPHELQIAIEVTDADARWLYLNCNPVANNHDKANAYCGRKITRRDGKESLYQPHICYKFNSAQNIECPYQWSPVECDQYIQKALKSAVPTACCSRMRPTPQNYVGLALTAESSKIEPKQHRKVGNFTNLDCGLQRPAIAFQPRKVKQQNRKSEIRKIYPSAAHASSSYIEPIHSTHHAFDTRSREAKQLNTISSVEAFENQQSNSKKGAKTFYETVKPLDNPTYADFIEIRRCIHFDDFEDAARLEMLVPQPYTMGRTSLQRRVLWFAASKCGIEHNFYGNVSFSIKWETAQRKLGPNLYLLDQKFHNSRSFTRLILTKNNYSSILDEVDLNSDGSPLTKSESDFRHASHCMNKVSWGAHELQIAIEVSDVDARWLYFNCKPIANNHVKANGSSVRQHTRWDGNVSLYQPHTCYKFNSAQNSECPYQWTSFECELNIRRVMKKADPITSHSGMRSLPQNTVRYQYLDVGQSLPVESSQRNPNTQGETGNIIGWNSDLQPPATVHMPRHGEQQHLQTTNRNKQANIKGIAKSSSHARPSSTLANVGDLPYIPCKASQSKPKVSVERPAKPQFKANRTSKSTYNDRLTRRCQSPSVPITHQPLLRTRIETCSSIAPAISTDQLITRHGTTPALTNTSWSPFKIFLDCFCCRNRRKNSI